MAKNLKLKTQMLKQQQQTKKINLLSFFMKLLVLPFKFSVSARWLARQIAWLLIATIVVGIFSGVAPKKAYATASNGDGILFYAASGNTTPQFRTYDNATNDFSANAGTVVGAQPVINQIKTSPTRREAIAGYQDTSGNLRVLCYDGTTWSEDWTVAVAGAGTPTTRRFDIAYETATGDVTVAYSRNTAAVNALAYRTKAGSTGCGTANWAAAANFPTTTTATSATVMWVKAARDGRSAQNLSAWVWLDNAATNADLGGAIWSGSAFTNFKQIETSMEHQSAVGDSDNFDVQAESLSGEYMVVWGNSAGASGTNGYRYMTCTGGTSGCTWSALTTLPGPADECMTIDLSADPLSNKMAMAGIGGVSFDMSAGYWDGTGPWTGYANVDTSTETTVSVGSKKVTTGWLTNNGNTKWYISYDDNTGTGIGYKYAINGGAISSPSDYTSTPSINDTRGRYDTDMNPFNPAELIQSLSDSTNQIVAYKLTMDSSGNLAWSNMASASSLGTKPNHPQQGFSYQYWRNTSYMTVATDSGSYPTLGQTITVTATAYNNTSANRTGTHIKYIIFIDGDSDGIPDIDETYITAACAGSAAWASEANFTWEKTGLDVAANSNAEDIQSCANNNFPSNTTYTIWAKWHNTGDTIIYATATVTFTSVPTLTELLFMMLIGCAVFLGVRTGVIRIRKNGNIGLKDIQDPPNKHIPPVETLGSDNKQIIHNHQVHPSLKLRVTKSIDGISRREYKTKS